MSDLNTFKRYRKPFVGNSRIIRRKNNKFKIENWFISITSNVPFIKLYSLTSSYILVVINSSFPHCVKYSKDDLFVRKSPSGLLVASANQEALFIFLDNLNIRCQGGLIFQNLLTKNEQI